MAYQLVGEWFGHQGDIRSVCALSGGRFASGSRDRMAKVWQASEDEKTYTEVATLYDHEHWVSCILGLPNGMGFVTGSQDKKIRWYDENTQLVTTIDGHEGPVSSLAWNDATNELVSGSWDGTARTWALDADARTYMSTSVLAGHENGACVLALPNGDIVTGSAGVQVGNRIEGFQLRVWKNGKVVKTLHNHQGAIRSLCKSAKDGSTFASTSNDGTVRVWSSDSFEELLTLCNPPGPEGGPAFNFCVTDLGNYTQLGVACDDCCARVWNLSNGALEQEIFHPCTVWWVAQLENGDIVTGGSDGSIRVFTTEEDRAAPEMVRQMYAEQAHRTREAIARKASNGGTKVDPTKLPKFYEAPPGTVDGDVRMFNKSGEAWVYQWSEVSGTWVEVGEVMGDAGEKEELDGEYFDKVVPVEVEDPATGGLRKLKLGFNNGDNPYMVAQMFVQKHGLDENNTQDIVDFIQRMRGSSSVPTIDMSGGAGAVSSGGENKEPDFMQVDEVASQNRLVPLQSAAGMAFESIEFEKVLLKLEEFNSKVESGQALTEREMESVRKAVEVLKNTSRYHASEISSESVKALQKALSWGKDYVFPAMDLLRVLLTHPNGSEQLAAKANDIIPSVLSKATDEGASLAIALIAARLVANFYRHTTASEAATSFIVGPGGEKRFLNPLGELSGFPNKNVRSAVATCFLNASNALYHLARDEVTVDLGESLMKKAIVLGENCLDEGSKEAETARRCVMAIGCLVSIPKCRAMDLSDAERFVNQAKSSSNDTLVEACDAVNAALRRAKK